MPNSSPLIDLDLKRATNIDTTSPNRVMAVKDTKVAQVTVASISATSHKTSDSSVMADSSGLLQTLQGHVEEVRSLIQCGICVRPLYEPYTLGCGHTFCYGCLTSWFSSGRSHKTCPDCRAQVKTQPAPAYLVRAIVQMFTSNAELLDKDETTAEHSKNQREEADRLEADKSNDNPQTGGLFQGCFNPRPHNQGPIYDEEDGVARCPHCTWELEEDACMNCGYHVEDGTIDDSDDFSDMTDEDDEEDEDDEYDEGINDTFPDYIGPWPEDYPHLQFHDPQHYFAVANIRALDHDLLHNDYHHNHRFGRPWFEFGEPPEPPIGHTQASSMTHTSNDTSEGAEDDSEDEEEDEDEDADEAEMGSFIDDGSIEYDYSDDEYGTDRSTVMGDRSDPMDAEFDHSRPESFSERFNFRSPDEGTDGEEDDDEEEDDEPIRSAPIRRPGHNPSFRSNPIARSGGSTRTNRGAPSTISQAGGHQVRDSGTRGGPCRHLREMSLSNSRQNVGAGTSASNAINVEDDSEDEMPVSATRRSRNNRRNRVLA